MEMQKYANPLEKRQTETVLSKKLLLGLHCQASLCFHSSYGPEGLTSCVLLLLWEIEHSNVTSIQILAPDLNYAEVSLFDLVIYT